MTTDFDPPASELPIDLALESEFSLGALQVSPSTREVTQEGSRELLEPRLMQVLVALYRAGGRVVSRDALLARCWQSRIVSEDAISRVITRLRRLAEGSNGQFAIETIPRVGYRLLIGGSPAQTETTTVGERTLAVPSQPAVQAAGETWPALASAPSAIQSSVSPSTSRRALIALGAAAAGSALAGGGWWWWGRTQTDRSTGVAPPTVAPSPQVALLMQQAETSLYQSTSEGQTQAIGLYRRVITLEPNYADGWGALGVAYTIAGQFRAPAESNALRERARAAARLALALDPQNGLGQVAAVMSLPTVGNWLAAEQALRGAIAQHPRDFQLNLLTALWLAAVGRNTDAIPFFEKARAFGPPVPGVYFSNIRTLWAAGRIEEADRLTDEAFTLYPTHFALWFIRCYRDLYSGRPDAAMAQIDNLAGRPTGIPPAEFERVRLVAKALSTHAPADIDTVLRVHRQEAHRGAGYAENSIGFLAALGDIDGAFAIAQAYYFGRGFAIPDVRFTPEQGTYSPQSDRLTEFLFDPPLAPLRADPRFDRLVEEIGLKRYWAAAGVKPDYQRG